MVFKVLIKSDIIKSTLNIIKTITNEAKFKVTLDGITVNAVDPATVAMVSMELSNTAFITFEVTDCELGIDITKLLNILEMSGKDEDIELELDDVSHKLAVKMLGLSYFTSLLDPTSIRKEPKVPSFELPVSVEIKCEDMKRAVKAAEKVDDYILIGTEAGNVLMSAEGDTDTVRIVLEKEQCVSLELGIQGDIKSLFSLDYLSNMVKVIPGSVMLKLGTNYPMLMSFKFADGHGNVSFVLAPRVESD